MYPPSDKEASIFNIYLNKHNKSRLFKLISDLKSYEPKLIFVSMSSDQLSHCQNLPEDFAQLTIVLRDENLNPSCLKVLKEKELTLLSFAFSDSIDNESGAFKNVQASEFAIDLGKGEKVFINSAKNEFFSQFNLTPHLQNLSFNLPLAFSKVKQVNGEELLKHSKVYKKSLKDKVVFVGIDSLNHLQRPFSIKSVSVSDTYYLSTLYQHLNEKTFLKEMPAYAHYLFLLLIFAQVFLIVNHCGQVFGFVLMTSVFLQVTAVSVASVFFFDQITAFGHGIIVGAYAWLHFQILKRFELERTVKRTQKLLSKRSDFNSQVLNQQTQFFENKKESEFDKYFTKLEVVDSTHGIIPMSEIKSFQTPKEESKDSSLDGAVEKTFKIKNQNQNEETKDVKGFKINATVKKSENEKNETAKIQNKDSDHLKDIKIPSQQIPDDTPLMVENFKKLFANNLRRKEVKFIILNDLLKADLENSEYEARKREIFFEALCLQIIADAKPQSEIEFSTHKKSGYVIYVLTNQSIGAFNYKQWLNQADFFASLAEELKKQGVIIYQNQDLEAGLSEMAVAFKEPLAAVKKNQNIA